jgi:uncharacterized protein YcfJ
MSIHVFLMYPNPMGMEGQRIEAEMEQRLKGSNDPNMRRQRKPGDVFVIICAVIGAAIGGLVGGFFSSLAILGGIIAGGILGAVIYKIIKNRPLESKTKTKKEEPPQSPFIS